MGNDDDIVHNMFKVALECDESIMKFVRVFVSFMGLVLLGILILLFMIVQSSVTELHLTQHDPIDDDHNHNNDDKEQEGRDARSKNKFSPHTATYTERLRNAIGSHTCVRNNSILSRFIGQRYYS